MRHTPVFLIIAIGSFAVAAAGQTRTITNADLEKYKERRLAAERDLRENYAKLGFLSPEEQARVDERSRHERDELVNRLRAERLQREEAEAARRQADDVYLPSVILVNEGVRTVIGLGHFGDWRDRRSPNRTRFPRPVSDWRATPGGVIYEPGGRSSNVYSPLGQRPRPAFRISGTRVQR